MGFFSLNTSCCYCTMLSKLIDITKSSSVKLVKVSTYVGGPHRVKIRGASADLGFISSLRLVKLTDSRHSSVTLGFRTPFLT